MGGKGWCRPILVNAVVYTIAIVGKKVLALANVFQTMKNTNSVYSRQGSNSCRLRSVPRKKKKGWMLLLRVTVVQGTRRKFV